MPGDSSRDLFSFPIWRSLKQLQGHLTTPKLLDLFKLKLLILLGWFSNYKKYGPEGM